MNPVRWRAWLVAGSIFLLGLVLGGAGTAWYGMRLVRESVHAPAGGRGMADRSAMRIGRELTQKLDLTPDESARVRGILRESAANLKQVRHRARSEAAEELRASTARIAATLPPEKRAEFHRVIARRYERLGLSPPRAKE